MRRAHEVQGCECELVHMLATRPSESENETSQRIQRDCVSILVNGWQPGSRPKKYGDHISHDVKGGSIHFQPQILFVLLEARGICPAPRLRLAAGCECVLRSRN